jgi:histone-lysine N-methyltransferase SETMAR
LEVCRELQQQLEDDPDFLSKVVTGDKSWVYSYDLETKQQLLQWKSPASPRPKKSRQVHVDLFIRVHPSWSDSLLVFYCDVLRCFREAMRRKRPEKWLTSDWELHHDNAQLHTAYTVQECLPVVPHPPYSPDLAPFGIFPFPKMKIKLKGQRFDTVEKIQALTKIHFQDAFPKWKKCWDQCVHS